MRALSNGRTAAMWRASCAMFWLAALAGCATPDRSDHGSAVRRYLNPVMDRDFPDPAVLRAPDGWIYAYATQTPLNGSMHNIQVARSRNLVNWEHLGDALPAKPQWAQTRQNFWAPHVTFDGARYIMYYSAQPTGANGMCLAVAVSANPAGPFADSGTPLLCGENVEHIDPMAFDDPQTGKYLLYWGSGRKPLKVQELARDRLAFLPGSEPREILSPNPNAIYSSLIEGAWVTYRKGTYYLYFSGDRCCSAEPSYAVMVARSSSALGPFEPYLEPGANRNRPILARNGFWNAPGHNSVITDEAGEDWLLYHAVDAGRAYFDDRVRARPSARVLLLDRIEYRDGWPRIAGDQPSTTPVDGPAWGLR
jgi:arabinan endo-1,5-alpha-L-arabinosidase